MFCGGQVLAFLFGQMTKFWSLSLFFFGTNDQVLVSLNAHVHTLFNHDISNLLPFCKKNLEHVIIL
jgi:hypothetical protein